MAFKLTREEQDQQRDLAIELTSKLAILEQVTTVESPDQQEVSTAASMFQVILDDIESFRDSVASRLRDEYVEKSERWQESDKGVEVDYFISEWESADFITEIDILEPDITGLEEYISTLEDLPIGE